MNLSTKDIQMKNTLGKIFSLFILLTFNLYATLADYSLTSNKVNLVEKEAVELTFVATQTNHADVMFFFLEAKKSNNYKIILLNKKAKKLAYHHKQTTFTYLLFPLQNGDIKVNFDFTIKVASDGAVAQIYEGSRDNVKWIETTNTKIQLKPLVLHVAKLKHPVDLVGEFILSSSIDKTKIDAYESANLNYILRGNGYNSINIEPISKIEDVDLFHDITKRYEKSTSEGFIINREYHYALLSDKNIHIKPKSFQCYSFKNKKYYTLTTKEYKVDVIPIKKMELIDKVDFPSTQNNFNTIKEVFIYVFIFLTGFLTAKYFPTSFSFKEKKFTDIRATKDAKSLLYLVMHKYSKRGLEKQYEALNEIVYNNKKKRGFRNIKKEILKILES